VTVARFSIQIGVVGVALSCLTACSLPPSATCKTYVTCQAAVDATVDVSNFVEGGSCWVDPQTAQACTDQCSEALKALRALPRPPSACTTTNSG
jgi:hypothetical protein